MRPGTPPYVTEAEILSSAPETGCVSITNVRVTKRPYGVETPLCDGVGRDHWLTRQSAPRTFEVGMPRTINAPAVEPLLTVATIADRLACGRRTVERLRASGKLPPPDLHIGRHPRWRPETIRAWINQAGGDWQPPPAPAWCEELKPFAYPERVS